MRRAIRSVWAIELLLLLRGDRLKSWTAAELVRELRASSAVVDSSLAPLRSSGAVAQVEPGAFAYRPVSAEVDQLCDELEREFNARPATVVNAVAMGARSRLQGLADAFRFKDPKE